MTAGTLRSKQHLEAYVDSLINPEIIAVIYHPDACSWRRAYHFYYINKAGKLGHKEWKVSHINQDISAASEIIKEIQADLNPADILLAL